MKNKKYIILIIIALIFVVAVTTSVIRAWLTDTKKTSDSVFTIGDITYEWDGEQETGKIVPGQNLIKTVYTLTNSSTIYSELRVKIEVTSAYLDGDAISYVQIQMDTGWVLEDGHWYYRGAETVQVTEGDITKYNIQPLNQVIKTINSISLDGSKVGNDFSGSTFTLIFTFQAKQSDYVTWSDLGQLNFETGLAS
jgi:hypothetical protein